MYQVTNIVGTAPQTVASAVVFETHEEAEEYAAGQYIAQTMDPLFPSAWWTINKVDLVPGYEYISGYPSPFDESPPNTPTDISATTDGTSFTVSWVPNSPPSDEYYLINFNCPNYEFNGGNDTWSPNNTAITTIWENDLSTAGASITTTAQVSSFTFPAGLVEGENWPGEVGLSNSYTEGPYPLDLSFSVTAINSYGTSDMSTLASSVIAYGPTGSEVPATPTDLSLVLSSTAATYNTYTLSWDQSYPSGSAAPTSWIVNAPFHSTPNSSYTVTASGTPSTGTLAFTATSAVVAGNYQNIVVTATNANGASALSYNGLTAP